MEPVLLTREAGRDDLSERDYREIYEELRDFDAATGRYGLPLDRFVALVGSAFSKGSWSKYHRGEMVLNRTMRGELRRAVGMSELPMTVGEAVGGADVNAEVWRIGEGEVGRVLLVGAPGPLRVMLNGRVSVEEVGELPGVGEGEAVTGVTRRRKRCAVSLPEGLFGELNAARLAAGVGWSEFLRGLL